MKNFFLFLLFTSVISCASFKNKNPFIGVFQVNVLDIDDVGDVPAILSIFKNKDNYTSTIVYEIDGVENELEILSSYEVDNTTFIIETFLDGNQIDFELNFDNDNISGIAAGIFEVEGTRLIK